VCRQIFLGVPPNLKKLVTVLIDGPNISYIKMKLIDSAQAAIEILAVFNTCGL
jgi:hypothetical protein